MHRWTEFFRFMGEGDTGWMQAVGPRWATCAHLPDPEAIGMIATRRSTTKPEFMRYP